MKYLYKFGYGTCEKSESFECFHETKFTKEQVEQITKDGYAHICKICMNTQDWLKWDHKRSFQGNFKQFCKWLQTQGFTPIEFTKECFVFGWADINKPKDWEDYCNDLTKSIQTYCANTFGVSPPMTGIDDIKNIQDASKGK